MRQKLKRKHNNMSRSEKSLILILIIVGALGAFYFKGLALQRKILAAEEKERQELQNIYYDSFGKIKLEAKSAVIFDPVKKEAIFSFNPNAAAPMASIVKVMTAIVALESMPSGTIVTILKEALSEEGDTGLLLYEKWLLPDLVQFMLTVSSNDAAKALALASGGDTSSFIEAMNKKAADLGLGSTNFSNETGLDLGVKLSGATSSAGDIAEMLSYGFLNHKEIFEAASKPEIILTSMTGIKHKVKNTDVLVSSLKNILASKTGFTNLAGGNLAVVFKTSSGSLFSAVVLGSTLDGRFKDMEQLIKAVSKYADDIIAYNDGKNSVQN